MCVACVGHAAQMCASAQIVSGEGVRADARTPFSGAFIDVIKNMQANLAKEDHAMLVGRKLSVDWSLAPALLINDIMRGEPPSHWMAFLDDAYGRSAALTLDAENTPQEVFNGCALIKRQEKVIRFSYLAQRVFASGSEVPPAIEWECDVRPLETIMRSVWYEPNLAQRGVDFPIPPDRTLLSWTDQFMRLRVIEESADWSMKWPNQGPIFDHVGDAYDLFDALRAWHWAHSQNRIPSDNAVIPAYSTDRSTPRFTHWYRTNDHEWILAITLRQCAAVRRAGFIVKADGVDETTLPVGRPTVLVPIVCANTKLMISFCATRQPNGDIPSGTFLPMKIALRIKNQEVACASLHSFAQYSADALPRIDLQDNNPAWQDAIVRIRQAQTSALSSTNASLAFDEKELEIDATTNSFKSLLRARLAANAWTFAMRADVTNLMSTINRAQDLRRNDGLGNHDLAALETFAESLTLGHAPDSSVNAIRVRHALAAADLPSDALVCGCLAATGSGRFWAALDISHAGLSRSPLDSSDEEIWKLACAQLKVWCADPLSHTIFGADPGVLMLSQQIAFDHQSSSASLSESEVPSSTIDGKSAGAAYKTMRQILAPIMQRAE
jgi:hypothetical protein